MSENLEEKKENEGVMYEKRGEKKPNSPKNKWLVGVGAVLLAVVFFCVGWFSHFYSIDSRARTLLWLIDTLEDKYYEDVDTDALYSDLYDVVVPDKFSAYVTPEEYKTMIRESEGTSSNYGIALNVDEDTMRIALVVGNSSADRAGIRTGMYLYRFGGAEETLVGGGYEDLSRVSSENHGSIVVECGYTETDKKCYHIVSEEYSSAYCHYADSEKTFRFRDDGKGKTQLTEIETEGGIAGLDGQTAYIALTEFEGNAAAEFTACLNLMKSRGRANLIVDLRGNGGGYLTILQSIASHLMKNAEGSNPVVATSRYRSGKEYVYRADGNDYYDYFTDSSKISVLADEHSASASECLIGAMVDYGTADFSDLYVRQQEDGTVRTYGKGVMQSTYSNVSGGAFRLVVAKIFWPSGKNIHDRGVNGEDGVTPISAPLLRGQRDIFLEQVLEKL